MHIYGFHKSVFSCNTFPPLEGCPTLCWLPFILYPSNKGREQYLIRGKAGHVMRSMQLGHYSSALLEVQSRLPTGSLLGGTFIYYTNHPHHHHTDRQKDVREQREHWPCHPMDETHISCLHLQYYPSRQYPHQSPRSKFRLGTYFRSAGKPRPCLAALFTGTVQYNTL